MERNPYKAPDVRVDDYSAPKPPRPEQVTRACQIFWVVIVLSLLTLHPSIRGEWWSVPGAEAPEAAGFVGQIMMFVAVGLLVVFTVLFAVLVWLVRRGRNWARWVLLAYLILGWVSLVFDFQRSMFETPVAAAGDVLVVLAEVWACYLLFSGSGAQWFRPAHAP